MSQLLCPVGEESSTMVAIWYAEPDIYVALTSVLPEVPEEAVVLSVADLISKGLLQRVSPQAVSDVGEGRN